MRLRMLLAAGLVVLPLLSVFSPSPVLAAATLTRAATGGTSLSADSAVSGGTGAATALGPVIITEAMAGDIGNRTSGILIFQLPAGFQWDTASAVDVAVSGGGCQGLSFGPSSYGSSAETGAVDQVRFPITTLSTFPCAATFGGSSAFKVKPSAASPL